MRVSITCEIFAAMATCAQTGASRGGASHGVGHRRRRYAAAGHGAGAAAASRALGVGGGGGVVGSAARVPTAAGPPLPVLALPHLLPAMLRIAAVCNRAWRAGARPMGAHLLISEPGQVVMTNRYLNISQVLPADTADPPPQPQLSLSRACTFVLDLTARPAPGSAGATAPAGASAVRP